jgi:hypothetical protein
MAVTIEAAPAAAMIRRVGRRIVLILFVLFICSPCDVDARVGDS